MSWNFMSCNFTSCILMSCIFMPCNLVRNFHVRHFQRPLSEWPKTGQPAAPTSDDWMRAAPEVLRGSGFGMGLTPSDYWGVAQGKDWDRRQRPHWSYRQLGCPLSVIGFSYCCRKHLEQSATSRHSSAISTDCQEDAEAVSAQPQFPVLICCSL